MREPWRVMHELVLQAAKRSSCRLHDVWKCVRVLVVLLAVKAVAKGLCHEQALNCSDVS